MTEHIDRDALRKLADAVPSGPWYAHPAGKYVYSEDEGGLVQNWNGDWDALAGMKFIAAARTAIPALLDALEQAEAERDYRRRENAELVQQIKDERGAALDALAQLKLRDERIKVVRDVLEVEERSVANLDIGACGIEDGWSAAVPTSDIRRALEGP